MKITSGTKYLVDTNILVYGYDAKSPYHKKARNLLENLVLQNIDIYVSVQNIVELCNVLVKAYGVSSPSVASYVQEIMLDFKIIVPKIDTISLFLNLFQKTTKGKLYMFDVFLAATMLDNAITRIITFNEKDFVGLEGVFVYNPLKNRI